MADKPRKPPVPPEVDLKDFPFTPLYRARLFGSSFHARANDTEWRAGLTLWLKSQDQVPAGSLPTDDIDLCRLAELGRDLKTWRKIKTMALHGWYECDGRLYHDVVAEIVNEQWQGKLRRKWVTECARVKKHCQRHNLKFDPPSFEEWLSRGQVIDVPRDIEPMSPGHTADVPRENPSKGQGKGKGQGQGQGQGKERGTEGSLTGLSLPESEAEESVAARGNGKDESNNPVLRLSPPPQAPKPEKVRENIKKQLVQKLMRYCNSCLNDADRVKATLGLMGEDPEHDAQWWLDELDRKRKREGWDDTRKWKHQHLGTT